MRIRLQPSDNRPLYVQIMDEVRSALVRGTLGPEDPLPSVRELAAALRINPRTVSQAYAELEREGVLLVRQGRGTTVAPDVRPDLKDRPRLARGVARRALADAARTGVDLDELLAALEEIGRDDPKDVHDREEGSR